MGNVRRVGIHHNLHHAQACHEPAPQGFSRFEFAPFSHKNVIGRNGAVTTALHRLHPLRWQHLFWRPAHGGSLACRADAGTDDTGHGTQSVLHSHRASRTVHAFDHHTGLPQGRVVSTRSAKCRPLVGVIKHCQYIGLCHFGVGYLRKGLRNRSNRHKP